MTGSSELLRHSAPEPFANLSTSGFTIEGPLPSFHTCVTTAFLWNYGFTKNTETSLVNPGAHILKSFFAWHVGKWTDHEQAVVAWTCCPSTHSSQPFHQNSPLPILEIIPEAEKWLRNELGGGEFPFLCVAEAIANAFIHRDYETPERPCKLIVDQTCVTVASPGGPVEPVTLRQMQTFKAPRLSRNPIIHHAFTKIQHASELGTGLEFILRNATGAGLPSPTISYEESHVLVKFARRKEVP